jgi:hypothetical protein
MAKPSRGDVEDAGHSLPSRAQAQPRVSTTVDAPTVIATPRPCVTSTTGSSASSGIVSKPAGSLLAAPAAQTALLEDTLLRPGDRTHDRDRLDRRRPGLDETARSPLGERFRRNSPATTTGPGGRRVLCSLRRLSHTRRPDVSLSAGVFTTLDG